MLLYEITLKRRDKQTKERISSLTVHTTATDGAHAGNLVLARLKSFQEQQAWEICGIQSVREA